MYTIDASVAQPIMLLDRHIGYSDEDGYGIDGAAFARELMQLDGMGKECINIWINSPGGIVLDGYNIYNAILKSKTKVNTYCVGMAASIAAVIFQAGRERVMCDYGILMYHNPFGSENTDALKAMRDSIVKMISERSGLSEDDTVNMMRRETFMNASEALEKKMCDRIEGSADYNKKRMATAAVSNNAKGYYQEAQKIYNQLFKIENTMPDFAKIANKLKLVTSANEDAIIEGIQAIENRANTAEAELANVRNQLTQRDTKITELTNQLTEVKNKQETAEKEAKKVKAQALIQGAAKIGVIKNEAEVLAKWTEKATNDYDGTKDLLESLPVNKPASKIVTEGNGKETVTALENAAAFEMANIKNRLTGAESIK
jgi:ATP-dependent protease ClpP protease subunit